VITLKIKESSDPSTKSSKKPSLDKPNKYSFVLEIIPKSHFHQQASLNDLNSLQDPKSIHFENLSSLRNAEPKDQAHTQVIFPSKSHLT